MTREVFTNIDVVDLRCVEAAESKQTGESLEFRRETPKTIDVNEHPSLSIPIRKVG